MIARTGETARGSTVEIEKEYVERMQRIMDNADDILPYCATIEALLL